MGGGAAAAASAGWKIEQRSPGAWAAPGEGAEALRTGGGAYAGLGACKAASAISGLGDRALDVGGVYFSVPPYLVCAKGMEERGKKTSRRSEPPCRGCLAGET